ncbi:hypothetical protein [Clostridium perfringens]|uniref:DUF5673 domain-containing protein n=1 Tax=Clostridium perfringens (strain SM101 / Type A) TaxID=289380 RepID=Q0SV21_CLOPS|nr:hypothetical protein [Clostridium perfringens]ABG86207.1 hypothetical protein CPR_0703 [Clostridium perfringens SM101]MDK0560093.1 hypothetical protein [Clostridium perfringens]MDK0679765.1 hypothetical protein [Clostridium perfringens]MDK0774505.1 hypothetical protein [Clostridium perfringens]MDK0779696.1 hypothetical protein [Clostridium perfringens]
MILLAFIILGIYILINIVLLHGTKKARKGKKTVTIKIMSLISIIMFILSLLILLFGFMSYLHHKNMLNLIISIIYLFVLIFISYKLSCFYITEDTIIYGYNCYNFKDIQKIEIEKVKNKFNITIYIKGSNTLYFKLDYLKKKKLLNALHGKVLCINL